jgi:hypothetical protein
MSSGAVVESHRAAMLAALQITDELLRARQEAVSLDGAMRGLSAEVRRWLPPAKRALPGDGLAGDGSGSDGGAGDDAAG